MNRIRNENPNTQDYWDVTAPAHGFLEVNFDYMPARSLINAICHAISGHSTAWPPSLLDVGSGSGMILRRVLERFPVIRATACDFSHPAVDWLHEKLGIPTFWCDARNGPIGKSADASFDIVMCTEMIEHMDDPHRLVKELCRLARHLIIMTTPFDTIGEKSGEHVWTFNLMDMYHFLSPYGSVWLTADDGPEHIIAVCRK